MPASSTSSTWRWTTTRARRRELPGEAPVSAAAAGEIWHLKSDHGQVRANGDDVQLTGNVRGHRAGARGSGEPLTLDHADMRINTPTEFIETEAPVRCAGRATNSMRVGMKADLKAGTLRLESEVHGEFSRVNYHRAARRRPAAPAC